MKLGELIMQRAVELGGRRRLTYRELSARARAAGYTLNESTLNAYVLHPLDEPPKRRTMEALAVALDVSFSVVVGAVAESIIGDDGESELVQVADEPHVRAWVSLTKGRTEAERARMVDVIRSVAAALDASQSRERAGTDDSATSFAEDHDTVTGRDVSRRSGRTRNT